MRMLQGLHVTCIITLTRGVKLSLYDVLDKSKTLDSGRRSVSACRCIMTLMRGVKQSLYVVPVTLGGG